MIFYYVIDYIWGNDDILVIVIIWFWVYFWGYQWYWSIFVYYLIVIWTVIDIVVNNFVYPFGRCCVDCWVRFVVCVWVWWVSWLMINTFLIMIG